MTDPNKIKDLARTRAREILTNNDTFKNMNVEDQKKMYVSVVEDQIEALKNNGVPASNGQLSKAKKASDLIDDKRHEKGFEDGVDAFEDLVDSVDFPLFVRDLMKSVFDANIEVMQAQTQDYITLMKAATSELSKFIKAIDDTAAFAYLAENKSDEFGVIMEEDADGNEVMQLGNPNGEAVDIGDNQVKAQIMDAKIKMAQEQRAILRETILKGVTRLVVEKGVIEAEVNFEFQGKRTGEKKDKALEKSSSSEGTSKRAGTGFLSKLVANANYGNTKSKQTTKFSVSSAKSTSEDELKAKLRGFVKLEFKTDYFKLDNFAQMYSAPSEDEKQAALPAG
ncbi:hypothetical protein [Flavivirga algicola]|uniref:Uncharacterized protein n=1 Tax=Flavivirga algicola TaxID=2729136 RepID=A0ABX1RYX9_9FLAO|nr:hypothetical protein [Flavivirga algicola]NMH88784.1 hypothetical protein [Flavivirga algicola]